MTMTHPSTHPSTHTPTHPPTRLPAPLPEPGPAVAPPEPAGPEPQATATLRAICASADALLRTAARPPRRLMVSVGSVSIDLEWEPGRPAPAPAAPAPAGAPAGVPAAAAVEAAPPPLGPTVNSPLVGTFFSAPEPGAAPFVSVGDLVEPGRQVGIVEAMKLMNPVEADRHARVVRVLVGNGEPVEYDQPLLVLDLLDEEG